MINIAMFVPKNPDGCAFYRGMGVFGELHRSNIVAKRMYGQVSWMDLSEFDIGFMQRPYNKEHLSIAKMIKQQMPLWIDYDDFLFAIPESNPSYNTYMTPEVQDNMEFLLNLADVVTVSTKILAEKLKEITKTRIDVVPNAYNDYRLPLEYKPIPKKHKVILWRGTNSHLSDLLAFKQDILALIAGAPKDEFVFFGIVPWILGDAIYSKNVSILPERNLFDFHRSLEVINPDVLLVPLEENEFNRCKSNIAWLETARFGTHVLVPSLMEEWFVPNVVNTDYFFLDGNGALNMEREETGWNFIKEHLLLSHVNQKRIDVISSLL